MLVHQDVLQAFIGKCKSTLLEFFGADPQKSSSFGRIINRRHFDRVTALLLNSGGGAVIAGGGPCDSADLFVPPTIILEPDRSSALMTEEIFGEHEVDTRYKVSAIVPDERQMSLPCFNLQAPSCPC